MTDSGQRDDDQRSLSLLSLGRALRGEAFEAPATADNDAVVRHRLARSRRQARPSPLLVALADTDREVEPEDGASPVDAQSGTAGGEPEPAVEPEPATPTGEAKPWRAADFLKRWLPGDGGTQPAAGVPSASPVPAGNRQAATPRQDAAPAARPRRELPAEPQSAAPPAYAPVYMPPPTYAPAPAYAPPPAVAGKDMLWRPLIDPMKVISGIFNSKLIVLGTTIAGALLGAAIALSTPKKYEAFAELLIDPRDLKLADRDLMQTGLPSDATLAIIENQVRVLTSGTVLTKVVDKLNLTADPEFNGNAGGISGIGDLIGILRSILSRKDGGDSKSWRERALAVQSLAEALKVERSGKTFVVSIGAKTEDPEKSALIANTLIDVFFQTYGEFQSNTAGRAADELTSRLDELRKGVEAAERKVEAFKAEHDIIDAQGRPITDDEILRLNEQLATARARTLELSARAQSTRSVKVDNVIVGTLPEEILSSTMTELRAQYARLKQDSDRLGVRLGPRHPERLAAEAQLAGARDQIAAELQRIVSASQTELRRAVQLEQDLAARLAQIKVSQGDRNSDLVTLRELEREVNARRAVYEGFLLRAREAGEARDVNTANMSVISAAYPPLDPLGPSRATIMLTGMVLGFFAGVGIGAARGAYWSFRDNAERRHAETAPTPPDDPDGAAAPNPQSPATRQDDTVASPEQPSAEAVLRAARDALESAEREGAEALRLLQEEPSPDLPESEEDDQAMKPDPFADPRYAGAMPPPGAYPYPYPPPGPYAHPMATPYPPHPAAGGYPPPPAPWPPHAMAPYPWYPYPPQMHPGAYPPPPAYPQPLPAAAEPVRAAMAPAQEDASASIEQIRATLREFRDMVREMTESRQRQRSA